MKSLPPALQAHLDGGATTLAWCWRITRADGVTLGFTDHDRRLAFDGTDFEPAGGFTASELRTGSDLAVDAQDAEGVLHSDRITASDLLEGLWDGAEVEIWRVNWADPAQRVLLRRGTIGEIRRGRVAFRAEMRSLSHLLAQPVGRLIQGTCDAALGDARCGVDLTDPAWRGTGAVTEVERSRAFRASGLDAFADGLFALGLLHWTAGANAGRRVGVARHESDDLGVLIVLAEEPLRPVAVGDSFSVTAGCDKRVETCANVFGNAVNFRGFPHVPGQDTLMRYATNSEASGRTR